MAKLTFDQALERIGDCGAVKRDDIQRAALRRKVWSLTFGCPGCLPDSFATFTRRADALEYARDVYAPDAPMWPRQRPTAGQR